MFDYTKGVNIAWTRITPEVYVSSAKFPGRFGWGFETWIFSDDPTQRSKQIWHRSEKEALKIHGYIVDNLRAKDK